MPCSVIVHIDELVPGEGRARDRAAHRRALIGACARAGADGLVLELGLEEPASTRAELRELRDEASGCPVELRVVATTALAEHVSGLALERVTLRPAALAAAGVVDGSMLVTELAQVSAVIAEAGGRLPGLGLMIAPDRSEVEMAHLLGVQRVRLDVQALMGRSAAAADRRQALDPLRRAAVRSHELGLTVAVGGGLSLADVAVVGCIGSIDEVEIGGALLGADALAELPRVIAAVRDAVAGARRAFEVAVAQQSKTRR